MYSNNMIWDFNVLLGNKEYTFRGVARILEKKGQDCAKRAKKFRPEATPTN